MDVEAGGVECNMHTRAYVEFIVLVDVCANTRFRSGCGGMIRLYFVVNRCSMLYLYASNGSFAQTPYLDVHRKVDISVT